MSFDADVIVIGAGGGGAVVAKELGENGLKVLLLDAGPWYGNKKWPNPNQEPGAAGDSSTKDLSHKLLERHFSDYENDMNDYVSGKFRWGPANRNRAPWFRNLLQLGFVWQSSGIGGTTLLYWGNSPRAYPLAVDNIWPIPFRELIPYYEKVEATLPIRPAPMTAKEELFFYGAKKAGWSMLTTLNPTTPGYRPQPNAILQPNPNINNPEFEFEGGLPGCTLRGHCVNGCHMGPTFEQTAKRSTLVSYVPLALKTGNVEIRPNLFVTGILTEKNVTEIRATGVRFLNTWTKESGELRARVVVMSCGPIETPRLWLNSKLPYNPWVGKGMTKHYFDCVSGVFDEKVLTNILGLTEANPFVGQNASARFDYPGVGMIQPFGLSPGLYSSLIYAFSEAGYDLINEPEPSAPWDIRGRVIGTQLKELMVQYRRTVAILISTDDEVNQQNGISLDPALKDEHGAVPRIQYCPSKKDKNKRDLLAKIAADILRKAGAKQIIRSDWPLGLIIHLESTMRMGYVTDSNCEALQVKQLFIADNSVHFNGLGGPNPTLTTQALATRTAEKIAARYFI